MNTVDLYRLLVDETIDEARAVLGADNQRAVRALLGISDNEHNPS